MRRKVALVLLALAVCCAALSPLLRWYAFPRLARVPAHHYQATVMVARDATLLDYATMRARRVPEVTIVQTLRGDVEAAERIGRDTGRDVVVWDALSHVQGPDGEMVSRIPERYVFDPHTQEPVHAEEEAVDGEPVRRRGLEFKWPFLTEKRDYAYFDAQTRVATPIHYRGTRDFRGVEVYYFEQTIPWTRVEFPRTLPVEGLTAEAVEATGTTRWYTTVRRFWVEPLTGAPVYGEETHREELRGGTLLAGRDRVTAFSGHVKMREDYVRHTVDAVAGQRLLVLLLSSHLPWGLAVGAGALLVLALRAEARGVDPGGRREWPRRGRPDSAVP
ncbi:DUF3068 domain-containing protein [Streptomyces sp. HSG2]|uniref:DUF3068 domain-containing protein n=1 Tax=Streptomyces sp. HSG2 TaxID=2797167 RepID=UPI0019034700|nr:DUF3068 domain-containing protein [Streptomyces sp. HSG2]